MTVRVSSAIRPGCASKLSNASSMFSRPYRFLTANDQNRVGLKTEPSKIRHLRRRLLLLCMAIATKLTDPRPAR